MKPEEIRQRRVALGMTQADLAALFELNNNTISRWETGATKPESTPMLALALDQLELRQAIRADGSLKGLARTLERLKATTTELRQSIERRRVRN